MINLEDYPKFKRDLEKKVISVVPLVIIDSESSDPIFVSTQKGLFDEDMFFEEYDLEGEGIVTNMSCSKCPANYLIYLGDEDE